MSLNTRFKKQSDGVRLKTVYINGITYKITIEKDVWSRKVSNATYHWIKETEKGRKIPFRWGKVAMIESLSDDGDSNTIHSHPSNIHNNISEDESVVTCDKCGRIYNSRSGYYKHSKTCVEEPSNIRSTEPITIREGETVSIETPVTASAQNVTVFNNYGNLQNNVNIREIGKENAKWLTSQILYEAIQHMPSAVQNLIEKKHFNDEFPENKNLRIHTKRDIDKRISVWENGRWKIRDSKQTFYKVLLDIHDILSDALDEDEFSSDSESETDSVHARRGETEDERHTRIQIANLRRAERFVNKLQRIRPLWKQVQDKIDDQDKRMELWEDLKTLLLDRQLALEQGFD